MTGPKGAGLAAIEERLAMKRRFDQEQQAQQARNQDGQSVNKQAIEQTLKSAGVDEEIVRRVTSRDHVITAGRVSPVPEPKSPQQSPRAATPEVTKPTPKKVPKYLSVQDELEKMVKSAKSAGIAFTPSNLPGIKKKSESIEH